MARTASNPIALGTVAPNFSLMDVVSGQQRGLQDLRGERGTLIMFICNHCPFVKHIEQELRDIAGDYQRRGIGLIAINANDADNYPEDAPQYMAEKEFPFPYLYDETQLVARAYDAACTPDLYLFDEKLALVYHGQLDNARPGNEAPVDGKDLRQALDQLLQGKPVNEQQTPSMGCNIKWRD